MRKLPHAAIKTAMLVLALLFVSGGLSALWAATTPLPDFNSFFEERIDTQSTKIYDRTGKVVLYDVHGRVRRTVVPLTEISDYMKKATIAIEDADFYNHQGIKLTSIARAFIVNLTAGGLRQGGSTITQQVVKNVLLTREKSIARKVKEIVLALKLEQAMSKDEILALYLNEIPYGGTLYGAEEAARAYFGKQAKDLTLAESAYLAALPQAPTYYSPYGEHRDRLDNRKNLVLEQMYRNKLITKEEHESAKKEVVRFSSPENFGIKAPHFVFFIKSYLEEKYGKESVENKGLRVITTLDWEMQQIAEETVSRYGKQNQTTFNASNASLVAIDPKTGQILSMVGSRDYFNEEIQGNFNAATSYRQPGSSFKPIVYATAFNKGYTTDTIVFDLPTQFDTGCGQGNDSNCYTPQNYDDKFLGPVTLRSALAQSRNIPAIKVLYLAGVKEVIDVAQKLGITSLGDWRRYGLTLVLGGGEVSLLELTGAYGAFANDGIINKPVGILRIEDGEGRVLEEFKSSPERVLPEQTARMVSDILSDNAARTPAFGANSPLFFPGRTVAAKTGTTNDYRDAWIVGYTPNLAVGTWAGNNDNSSMSKRVAGMIVAPMWNAFMNEALKKVPEERFVPPTPTNPNLKPILRGVWVGPNNEIHDILHWVDKNNPLGTPPSSPSRDPQYSLWEGPVRRWLGGGQTVINGSGTDNPSATTSLSF